MNSLIIIAAAYAVWNLITFGMMGIDKKKAVHNKQRISERALLTSAFFMGGAGSLAGSLFFHHKTKKLKFQLLLPFYCLCNLAIIIAIWYFMKI